LKDNFLDEENRSEKCYVLGRKEGGKQGLLKIGRYYALDSSLGTDVYVDVLHPHIILICGKRGYGKSYTAGVFIEEIGNLEKELRENLGVVVFDTLGIFWTMSHENKLEKDKLEMWGMEPKNLDVLLMVPKKYVEEYKNNGIAASGFSLRVAELSSHHWLQLFDVKSTEPFGIALTRAVQKMQSISDHFSINDLLNCIRNDERWDDHVKGVAENLLSMAESWGVFDENGVLINDLVSGGRITILDVSHLADTNLKSIVISVVAEKIFEERVKERKIHEQEKMGISRRRKGIPMVWLFIDEAQLFLPNDKQILSKDILINSWMRQGRQPGLSLVMATQRPSALESEVLSHSDIIICHRLTTQEDIDALSRIRPTYMHGDIKESVQKIGDEKGVALLIDDNSESIHIVKIRPRLSWHGGSESLVMEPVQK
jgi:DNA helicase HerA-like ATPase